MSLVCCGCGNVGVILTPAVQRPTPMHPILRFRKNLKAIVSGGSESGCRLFVVAVGTLG